MSTTGLPEAAQTEAKPGVTAGVAAARAKPMLLHNSRFVCWTMKGFAIGAVLIGICMVLMAIPLLQPLSALGFMRGFAALQWVLGGVGMGYMGPGLWKWSTAMAYKRVKMDERGAEFELGTKKAPQSVFLRWDEIASITQTRVGGAIEFMVKGSDGSFAQFSSYSFFRARRVARLIAERAGLLIQKS